MQAAGHDRRFRHADVLGLSDLREASWLSTGPRALRLDEMNIPRHRLTTLGLALLTLQACGGGTIDGTVGDYHTGEPIVGADVTVVEHGWGFSNGTLVWDKDKSTTVTTDPDGSFTASFRHGASAKLRVRSSGYQAFEAAYARGAAVRE